MRKPNPLRPFTPDPAQIALRPDVTGNQVNGLGETEFRRPRMVYWAPDPDDIAHGDMQRWFYTVDPGDPEFNRQRAIRQMHLDRPLPAIAKEPARQEPLKWTSDLSRFISAGLCEQVGVADLNADWLLEGAQTDFSIVLIFGVQHDYEEISAAPAPSAGAEVMRQYTRAVAVAKEAACWLREQGWDAEPVLGPMTGKITLIPPALASGFGELGKHGSIINPEMGSSFRLSAVMTNAPFAPTPEQTHGIDEFCQNCRICEDACPPEALSPVKQVVRGVTKWYVDFDRCLPFFNQHQGCAICIAVCPWSRPGVGPNLAAKLARRAQRLDQDGTNR